MLAGFSETVRASKVKCSRGTLFAGRGLGRLQTSERMFAVAGRSYPVRLCSPTEREDWEGQRRERTGETGEADGGRTSPGGSLRL